MIKLTSMVVQEFGRSKVFCSGFRPGAACPLRHLVDRPPIPEEGCADYFDGRLASSAGGILSALGTPPLVKATAKSGTP